MASDEEITEPPNSTVDDWLGQEVDKDQDLADEAMREAGGDTDKAEEIFDERSAGKDGDKVPTVPESERDQNRS